MEGRLTAATAELDYAIESAAAAANTQAGDADLEALSGTPFTSGAANSAAPPTPGRECDAAADWRYSHHFDPIDARGECLGGSSSMQAATILPSPSGALALLPGGIDADLRFVAAKERAGESMLLPQAETAAGTSASLASGTPR